MAQNDLLMRLFSDTLELYKPTMFFTGVSTHNSFVNEVFHDWLKILDKDAELIGINLDVDCDSSEYLRIVEFIKSHSLSLGSLVTTHKVRLYNSAKYLFDDLPETCLEFKEIGCIYKNENSLCAEVSDLFSVIRALNAFLPENYFESNPVDFCVLGSGGAGLALGYRVLVDKNLQPKRLILTDINENRLETIRRILKKYDNDNILELRPIKGNQTDSLIEKLE